MSTPRDITEVYPRLRNEVYFAPTTGGAHLVDGERVVTVQSQWAYPLLERLAPHLTGDRSVADLTNALDDEKRGMVERLVSVLRDENFIRDAGLDRPHRLSPEELQLYGAEVAFVESFRDSAASRFQAWRDIETVIVGAGSTVAALAGAVLRSGVRSTTVHVIGGLDQDLARIKEHRAIALERDPAQRLTVQDARAGLSSVETLAGLVVPPAGVVLHACGLPCAAHAAALDDLCQRTGTTLVQAVTQGDEVWIGPVTAPGRPDTGWRAAWLRIQRGSAPTAERSGDASSPFLSGPASAVLANQLVFAAFNHVTGVTSTGVGPSVIRLDLETLTGEGHSVVPHPDALAAEPSGADDVLRLAERCARSAPVDDETFSRTVAALLDERTGVLTPFDEGDIPQLPLRVTRVTSNDPGAGSGPVVVHGAALDFAQARFRAARRALAVHASLRPDPRRRVHPHRSADEAWVHGVRALDGVAAPVPERQAFPSWYAVRGGAVYRPPVGMAAAPSWHTAVEEGLLDHCANLAAQAAQNLAGSVSWPRLRISDVELDQEGNDLLRLLEITGKCLDIRHISIASVAVYAFLLDGATICYQAALSTADAVREGLRKVLLAYQATSWGRSDIAPPTVPPLPCGNDRSVSQAVVRRDDSPSPAARVRKVAASLTAAGPWQPVVVPLDAGPNVSAVLPYIIQVVLSDV
ncbi:hypothetical protein [Streptomyces sp. NPDC047028]|uniref:hypothetical protein n=1 Tax=Streptomyces sp. NPDC047028 TaxID=3155793 RepID=UPI0033D66701